METKIIIIMVTTLIAVINGVIAFFTARMVRGFDKQIEELFKRTEDLPGIRKDIEWLKKEDGDKK